MAKNSIGVASLTLATDPTKLDKGLDGAHDKVNGWAGKVSAGTGLGVAGFAKGLAGGFVGAAAFAGINKLRQGWAGIHEQIDTTSKKARAFGITTESLAGLQHAARLGGSSVEELHKGLARFAMTAEGPVDEALAKFADQTKDMAAGDKITAFREKFGKAGDGLIPMLEDGSAGLKAMKDDALGLGIALNATDTAKFEKANDAIERVKLAGQGLVTRVLVAVAPALEFWADAFTSMLQKAQPLFDWVGRAIEGWWGVLGPLANEVGTLFLDLTQGVWDWVSGWLGAGENIPSVGEVIKNVLHGIGAMGAVAFDSIKFGIGAVAVGLGKMLEVLGDTFGGFKKLAGLVDQLPSALKPVWAEPLKVWADSLDQAVGDAGRKTQEWGNGLMAGFGNSLAMVDAWFDKIGKKADQTKKKAKEVAEPGPAGQLSAMKFVSNTAMLRGTAEELTARIRFSQGRDGVGQQQLSALQDIRVNTKRQADGVDSLLKNKSQTIELCVLEP